MEIRILRPHPTKNVNAGVADEVQLRDRRNFKMGHKLKVLTNDLCHNKNQVGSTAFCASQPSLIGHDARIAPSSTC